jgi:hypothetical protein
MRFLDRARAPNVGLPVFSAMIALLEGIMVNLSYALVGIDTLVLLRSLIATLLGVGKKSRRPATTQV